THKPAYYTFLFKNAHAVWFNDRNDLNQLGLKWDGPFDSADAARQSSAMMAVSGLAEPITADLSFAQGSGDPAFSHSVGSASGTLGWTANAGTSAGFLQYGPYISYLSTGMHAAHFQMAVDSLSASSTNVAHLDIRENKGGALIATGNVQWNA